jgi:hypothetical protein
MQIERLSPLDGDHLPEKTRHGTPEPGCPVALGVVRMGEMKMLSSALKTPFIRIPGCEPGRTKHRGCVRIARTGSAVKVPRPQVELENGDPEYGLRVD